MAKGKKQRRRWLRTLAVGAAALLTGWYLFCLAALCCLRWVDPPTTMVQTQRRIESWLGHKPYRKRQEWKRLPAIGIELQHAVIAAEDGRFFQHHGIDWKEVQKVVDQDLEDGKIGRGGSTITQQLVKNLFFTTSRSFLRKGIEFALAPAADRILGKQRVLELYLNVVEWGPGVWGAEAASRTWYGISCARLDRDQAARLAAILPAPVRRKPSRMNTYSAEIQRRMTQMW